MSDFLAELVKRLVAANNRATEIKTEYETERSKLELAYRAKQAEADEEYRALETLIRHEEQKTGAKLQQLHDRLPLQDFFIIALSKNGPLSKEDLRGQACRAGYFSQHDGGRTTHATVLNLAKSGRIAELLEGRYSVPSIVAVRRAQPPLLPLIAKLDPDELEDDEWGEPLGEESVTTE